MNKKYENFMLESNRIEGEYRINPCDISALKIMISDKTDLYKTSVLSIHGLIGEYLKVDWTGKYRTCNVQVGGHIAPPFSEVSGLMKEYFKYLPIMDSWTAHNEFETIHPFQDLNGRMGRLIWLKKAIGEGYDFSIPFLQKYYYQTLSHQNNRQCFN